ncbi:MAG: hypothetical protein Q4A32_00835 [Lachnospiraceae bacterium]|nr:hypothetical protein [Lachnospiraceae bacterium]
MKAREVVELVVPYAQIAVMEPGFRGNRFIGTAREALKERRLMDKEVRHIDTEVLDCRMTWCINVSA